MKKNKNNQTADEFRTSTPSPFISFKSYSPPSLRDSSLPDRALVMRGLYLVFLFDGAEASDSAGLFRDPLPLGFGTVAAGFVGAASLLRFRPCSCCWRELEG